MDSAEIQNIQQRVQRGQHRYTFFVSVYADNANDAEARLIGGTAAGVDAHQSSEVSLLATTDPSVVDPTVLGK